MSEFKGIPIAQPPTPARSGEKYTTQQGFTAIKDGIKQAQAPAAHPAQAGMAARAPCGRRRFRRGEANRSRASLEHGVRRGEVPQHRRVLERRHRHHHADGRGVHARLPFLRGRHRQSARLARRGRTGERRQARCELMRLKYVVLTSVNRDDLPDGGAGHYAAAVRAIKRRNPDTAVEALTPDFAGVIAHVRTVLDSGLDVFAQNVETVRRLTHPVRDPRAGYGRPSGCCARPRLSTRRAHQDQPDARARARPTRKFAQTLADLRAARSISSRWASTCARRRNHLPWSDSSPPQQFAEYREWALELRVPGMRLGTPGAVELPGGTGARAQQRGARERQARAQNRAAAQRRDRGAADPAPRPGRI